MASKGPACAAIVPSRGRPGPLGEFLDAFGDKSVCTELFVCLDDDDPSLPGYATLMNEPRFTRWLVNWQVGPRQGLAAWTNQVAKEACRTHEALISLGDDHRPVTPGWDRELLAAARGMGGGWAYGDDGLQHENLPTAFLVTSAIVRAVGWMLGPPGCAHMCVDAAARDLADKCGRRAYCPDVQVKHLHYTSGLSPYDQTYVDGYASWDADHAAYRAWLAGPIDADVKKAEAACPRSPST